MRAALVIAARILRQRLRDRSAIIFAVVTPLGLAVAFASVIPDFTQNYHTTIAVVDLDGGTVARALVGEGFGNDQVSKIAAVRSVDSEASARTLVDDDTVGAAVVIPAGFTASISSGQAVTIRILGGSDPVAREVARAVVTGFASRIGTVQLTVAALGATGGTVDASMVQAVTQAVAGGTGPIAVTDATAEKRQASLATFYGAAMAIMFVFFATQYGAFAVLGERRDGTLARLLAAPIRPSSIILGGAVAGFALGVVAMAVLVAATTLITHANWGPPLLVAALVAAAVVAAMGISSLVATLARTVDQAGNLNAIVAMCLASIGGVFIPLSQTPEIMTRIAMITPHAWFLRAIDTLSGSGVGIADILPSILVLLGMGLATGAVGMWRARGALTAA